MRSRAFCPIERDCRVDRRSGSGRAHRAAPRGTGPVPGVQQVVDHRDQAVVEVPSGRPGPWACWISG
jgi:hypothetical protein